MENLKYFSEMERFEIININDGEKYNFLGNNDIIIDEEGNFKYIILFNGRSRLSLFSKPESKEIPWDCVKKIGTKTVIIDVSGEQLR